MYDIDSDYLGALGELDLIQEKYGNKVEVKAGDYKYCGHLACAFLKLDSGGGPKSEIRVVVQDSCGRLFIHDPTQITFI